MRADVALAAVLELQAHIGRLEMAYAREDEKAFWMSYDASHNARVNYRAALITAKRYYSTLDEGTSQQIFDALIEIERTGKAVLEAKKAQIRGGVILRPGLTEAAVDALEQLVIRVNTAVQDLRTTLGQA